MKLIVGKLTEGMPVELKIGALPDTRVTGGYFELFP